MAMATPVTAEDLRALISQSMLISSPAKSLPQTLNATSALPFSGLWFLNTELSSVVQMTIYV
jgi:hypothetical protein